MSHSCRNSPLFPQDKVLVPWVHSAYLLPANSSTFAPLSPLPSSSRTTSWMMREPMKAYSSVRKRVALGEAGHRTRSPTPEVKKRGLGSLQGWGRLRREDQRLEALLGGSLGGQVSHRQAGTLRHAPKSLRKSVFPPEVSPPCPVSRGWEARDSLFSGLGEAPLQTSLEQ